MSAFTNVSKSPLLGFVKKLFRKSDAHEIIPDQMPLTAPPKVVAPRPAPVAPAPVAPARAHGNGSATAHGNGNGHGGNGNGTTTGTFNGILLPLQSIIDTLPAELRDKVREPQVGEITVPVTFDKILSQLTQGVVKLPFGHIRLAAPFVFVESSDSDHLPVILPLNEILSRLNPSLLVRRNAQKQVAVPAEIVSPFDARGAGNHLSVGNAKPVTPAAPRTAAPPPLAPPAVPGRGSLSAVPTPLPPGASGAKATVAPVAPIAPPKPVAPPKPIAPPPAPAVPSVSPNQHKMSPSQAELEALIPMAPIPMVPIPMNKPVTPKPAEPTTPVAMLAAAPIPTLRIVTPKPTPPATPAPTAPVPPAIPLTMQRPPQPPVATPAPRETPILKPTVSVPVSAATMPVGLAALAESWPESVRQEIEHFNLAEARVALPVELIGAALKRGRVTFPWKSLRGWIHPTHPAASSPNDEMELDLPLNVVAPQFLARKSNSGPTKSLAIDEGIPNLFFGFPKPDAPAPVAPLPSADAKMAAAADTNYYVFDDLSEASRLDREEAAKKRKSPTGTEFVAKYATPNEIVSRAASLDGVAGALIALPDGLMVASRVPAELNGDTLAAFLPQIFAKVSMCTKELRMGDLNNLNFTVGNVPWKIFRVNAIFFAAFGRAAEAMPSAQLAALAGELDRKHK